LLSEKFQLFSGVFGASDEVLGAIESGVEFEKRIVAIYQNCRTEDDIETEFRTLREEMDASITTTMEDTRRKLLENFDAEVHDRLKVNLDQSREYMNRYERLLWRVTQHELAAQAKFDEDYLEFNLTRRPDGLDVPDGPYFLTKEGLVGHRYRLGHPLARYVLERAAGRTLPDAHITFDYQSWRQRAVSLEPFVGARGSMIVRKLSISSIDSQDYILIAARTQDGRLIDPQAAKRLFDLPVKRLTSTDGAVPADLQPALEKQSAEILQALAARQSTWFDDEMGKLDSWAEDKRAGLKFDLKELDDELKALKKEIRQTGNLPDKLALQRKARDLETKRDTAWRAYDEAAKEIEVEKDGLLDRVEAQLAQNVTTEDLFTIQYEIA
jgi:hypothetical protein